MKLEFIRKKLEEYQADAFVVINHEGSGQPDTAYLSSFSGSESVLIITAKSQYLLVDGRYHIRARQDSPDFEMKDVTRGKVYENMAKLFPEIGVKSILIDPTSTSYSSVLSFEKQISGIDIKTASGLTHLLRVVKSDEEINKLTDAAHLACNAFNKLVKEVKAGMTEKQVAARLEFIMKDMGAEKNSFDTIVASGKMGAFPHYVPGDKELQKGELVTIDFGCYLNGYASDMTRTIAIGDISDKLKEIYETVKGSQQAGLDAANSKISGKDLDQVCRKYIEERDYGKYFVHGTGHGIGMDVHEFPYVNSNNEQLLEQNSVITIEPGIYIEDVGGCRIEDCLVIKENGHINLNDKASKELITIGD